jgi:glutaredoxin
MTTFRATVGIVARILPRGQRPRFEIDEEILMPGRILAALRLPLGLAVCLALGYHATPLAVGLWRDWFPPPEFVVADNRAFFAEAGAEVVMFSDSRCPWCSKTREFLRARNVRFREYVIDRSPEARARYARLDIENAAVPVLLVGERRIVGYREAAFGDALRAAEIAHDAPPR